MRNIPKYYNPTGPGQYDTTTQLAIGQKSQINKFSNSPAYQFGGRENDLNDRSRSVCDVQSTGSRSGSYKRLDFLYPKLDQVRTKSPFARFPKEQRKVFAVKEEAQVVPVSYIGISSTMNKGRVRNNI